MSTGSGHSHNGWGNRWHIAAVTARYAKGLCPIYHRRQILLQAGFKYVGISRCDGHDLPTVAPRIVRMATTGSHTDTGIQKGKITNPFITKRLNITTFFT
jgi:hypothetical protein